MRILQKITKKDVPNLRYGVIHSQFRMADGVSIVMKQIEEVLVHHKNVPKANIFYLVGKTGTRTRQITQRNILWDKHPTNRLMLKYFSQGYGGQISEKIECAITKAKNEIASFISKNNIDILIVHNSSHPVNFISSIALSRYYRDLLLNGKKTPKYILWWHDSHLERKHFAKPATDVERYLREGVPGYYVEYIIFINSLQISQADNYFMQLDETRPGYYQKVQKNHDVIYNTTDTFIDSFSDLEKDKDHNYVDQFLDDFEIRSLLESRKLDLHDTLFCLQHTRIVERKRIDFAIKYCFELLQYLIKKKKAKAIYFFISGYDHDNLRRKLNSLVKNLSLEYKIDTFFLVYAQDYKKKTSIIFEEYPRIFAKLGGFTTYFSEIEGFGNNLLEVLASGLIPVVYTYPVFKKDIAKYKFKLISLDNFTINIDSIKSLTHILYNTRKRKIWINRNLIILKKHFSHKIIARKLTRAIIRKRNLF